MTTYPGSGRDAAPQKSSRRAEPTSLTNNRVVCFGSLPGSSAQDRTLRSCAASFAIWETPCLRSGMTWHDEMHHSTGIQEYPGHAKIAPRKIGIVQFDQITY